MLNSAWSFLHRTSKARFAALVVPAFLLVCSGIAATSSSAADPAGKAAEQKAAGGQQAAGGEPIHLVIGTPQGPTEQLAASEAESLLKHLFKVPVNTSASVPEKSSRLVVVGTAAANPGVKSLLGDRFPEDPGSQTIILRSFSDSSHSGVVVSGGSPAAVLWAVYELGHHFGVRWLPREDMYPVGEVALKLDGIDRVESPAAEVRGWELLGTSALGTTAWSLDQHRLLLGQLAKLRCNHVVLTVTDSQPFLDYEFLGQHKKTTGLFGGKNYSLEGDSPGRTAFPDERRLLNPDLPPTKDSAAALAAGHKFLSGLVQQAHLLGMTVELSIPLGHLPQEFRGVLYQAAPKEHARLLRTRLEAAVAACPEIDGLAVRLPENGTARSQLKQLGVLKLALSEGDALQKKDGTPLPLTVQHPHPALLPHLRDNLPAGAAISVLAGAPSGTEADATEAVESFTPDGIAARMTLPVAGPTFGMLSQFPGAEFESLVVRTSGKQWRGFVASCWMIGEIDLPVLWMFRTGFTPGQTLKEAHEDLFQSLTINPAATDRLWKGFQHIRSGEELLAGSVPALTVPQAAGAATGLIEQYFQPREQPADWEEAGKEYNAAFVEMYRARGPSHLRSKQFLFYYAKRSEFVVSWLAGAEALRKAAEARKADDLDTAIEQVDTAIESFYNALDTLGDVARTATDRAQIAVLNAELFRPLMALSDRLLEAADQ
ncbi:MAG: hypothetical protein KDA79_00640 [Planctomycetaceae bacterium]|nr:hypothetical protein [Planctomycetaceae bacterium]